MAEQPLYRLSDRIVFKANGKGAEDEPVNVDVTLYDPDVQLPDPPMWSLLRDDVKNEIQPIPSVTGRIEVLSVKIQRDATGNILPVEIENSVSIETSHDFLNDGSGFNYNLKGNLLYASQQSADLMGVIVRDETGAVRTDVTLISEEGVNYTLLVPEPSGVALPAMVGVVAALRRQRNRGSADARQLREDMLAVLVRGPTCSSIITWQRRQSRTLRALPPCQQQT